MEFNFFGFSCIILLTFFSFYTDIRYAKIYNYATIPFTLIGFLYHSLCKGEGIRFTFLGFIIGFFSVWVLYIIKAVGAGDIKLFGAYGSLVGGQMTLQFLMHAILFAGAFGLFCLVLIRIAPNFSRKILLFQGTTYAFPFMYAVLPGVLWTYYEQYLLKL